MGGDGQVVGRRGHVLVLVHQNGVVGAAGGALDAGMGIQEE